MTHALEQALTGFDWFVLGYFLVLNTSYLLLIVLATLEVVAWLRRAGLSGHDDIFANPLSPGVSVIVPAFDEEPTIVESTRAMLGLRYPALEVVVVDDGSTDGTFERLREAFDLVATERVIPGEVPTIGAVRSVHIARGGEPLVVVRKDNAGRRSDALNVGINTARRELVCLVDADSLLDEEALLRVVAPFVDDPARMVATGGVIRAANGSKVVRGRLVEPRMPATWGPRIQVLECLRSFLLGRTGWSRMNALLIISGAFGVFRRDVVVEVGGLDLTTLGEDAELVARIHHHMRRRRRPYRIRFVAEPVCWTEVPGTLAVLGRQRRRWSQGLVEVLWRHRAMMLNPRYGRIGLLALPYYLLFELVSPVIELVGVAAVVAGLAVGAVDVPFAILFAAVAFGYGLLLSLTALAIEEFTFFRYPRWRDLGVALVAAVLENVGYRQLHAWWRLQGLWRGLRGTEATWGTMTRSGFQSADDAAA